MVSRERDSDAEILSQLGETGLEQPYIHTTAFLDAVAADVEAREALVIEELGLPRHKIAYGPDLDYYVGIAFDRRRARNAAGEGEVVDDKKE